MGGFKILTSPHGDAAIAVTCSYDNGNITNGVCSNTTEGGHWPQIVFSTVEATCKNVVNEIEYTVMVAGQKVVSVAAAFSLIDVPLAALTAGSGLSQQFSVRFTTAAAKAAAAAAIYNVYPRSGNPGYIPGKPLLGGTLLSGSVLAASAPVVIQMAPDPSKWITMPMPNSDGDCPSAVSGFMPTSVTFGYGLVTTCSISVQLSDFGDCNALRRKTRAVIKNAISSATHIGRYGNSSQAHLGEWVKIDGTHIKDESLDAGTGTSCASTYTGLHLEVFTAMVSVLLRRLADYSTFSWVFLLPDILNKCA